jgi:hypothetical protein
VPQTKGTSYVIRWMEWKMLQTEAEKLKSFSPFSLRIFSFISIRFRSLFMCGNRSCLCFSFHCSPHLIKQKPQNLMKASWWAFLQQSRLIVRQFQLIYWPATLGCFRMVKIEFLARLSCVTLSLNSFITFIRTRKHTMWVKFHYKTLCLVLKTFP